jgi:hypothetical protein
MLHLATAAESPLLSETLSPLLFSQVVSLQLHLTLKKLKLPPLMQQEIQELNR